MKLRHALRGTAAGLLLAVCLTTPTLALTGVVDVGGSVLRVRKTASTGSAILDQLPSGKQVEIVDTATNGWYGIRLGSVKGYVSASYIKLLEEAAPVVTAEVSAVSASAAQSESTYVKVTADVLNVRTGPSTDYAVADELAQGKVVKVLGAQDGWYQIGSGYIDAAYTEAATYEEALEQLYIRVVQGPLNIRSGPGTGYSKVGSLAKGRCVKVVSVQSGWYQIEQGYVSAAYVEETDYTPAAASSKGQELANIALQYVGYSYVYGGASPRVGFDCSGLVQYACLDLTPLRPAQRIFHGAKRVRVLHQLPSKPGGRAVHRLPFVPYLWCHRRHRFLRNRRQHQSEFCAVRQRRNVLLHCELCFLHSRNFLGGHVNKIAI